MEKQEDFIVKKKGIKGKTYETRIRHKYPYNGGTIKVSKSFKTRNQPQTFKKIKLDHILQGTMT